MEEGVIQVTNSLGDVVRFDRHALPSRVVVWPIKLSRSDHNFMPEWDEYGYVRYAGSTGARLVRLVRPLTLAEVRAGCDVLEDWA